MVEILAVEHVERVEIGLGEVDMDRDGDGERVAVPDTLNETKDEEVGEMVALTE